MHRGQSRGWSFSAAGRPMRVTSSRHHMMAPPETKRSGFNGGGGGIKMREMRSRPTTLYPHIVGLSPRHRPPPPSTYDHPAPLVARLFKKGADCAAVTNTQGRIGVVRDGTLAPELALRDTWHTARRPRKDLGAALSTHALRCREPHNRRRHRRRRASL